MTTKITIDGNEYEIPRMKFKQLKRIWPRMKDTVSKMVEARKQGKSVDGVTDMFAATDDAIHVVAAAMSRMERPEGLDVTMESSPGEPPVILRTFSFEWIEEKLEINEAQQLSRVINELMIDTGLVKAGKLDPEAMKQLEEMGVSLTETGTPSSPSSSQPGANQAVGNA